MTNTANMVHGFNSSSKLKEGEILSINDVGEAHPIANVLRGFLNVVDSYRTALVVAIPAIAKDQNEKIKNAHKKILRFVANTSDDGTKMLKAENAHEAKEMFDAIAEEDRLSEAKPLEVVVKSIFIGLFSEYDYFIGELLKAIYASNPALYKGLKREISLTDLLDFSSIDDIKRDILEKEIDAFRRDSYIEQFSALEQMFDIKTLTAFPEWPSFVEMAQRRNLMTHNGGVVSQQYLNVCQRQNVKFGSMPVIGSKLELDGKYLGDALLVVSKIGFMLAHTLWRKISPSDIDVSNEEINSSVYDLLIRQRWRVAAAFGDFSLTDPIKRNIQDLTLKIRIINQAIALKNLNRIDDVNRLLGSVDWSACLREFSLAKAVLAGDYAEAAMIIRGIGKQGELITELGYHNWPLFNDFRGTLEFQEAYEDVYGIPFKVKMSAEAQREENVKNEQPKSHQRKKRKGADKSGTKK